MTDQKRANRPYVRQHFLPTIYLREFSADQSRISRTSNVWRCDCIRNVLVSVETQCYGKYFYSAERPAEAERTFHGMEGLYAQCIEAIKRGCKPSTEEFFGVILMVFDIFLRNAAYENETGEDNL